MEPKQLDTLLHPQFDTNGSEGEAEVIGKGLAASPGAACGQVVFSAEDAEEKVNSKEMTKVVLVRLETSPEDIEGMQVSQGILTVRGGMTSHAAVVARGMGTCCVCGCGDINEVVMDYDTKTFTINGHDLSMRATGSASTAPPATSTARPDPDRGCHRVLRRSSERFMGWADERRQLKVLTNADNPARRSERHGHAAPRASACAVPSICSLPPTGSRPCAR